MSMNDKNAGTYDVGILGWWYGKNYGSILTYYGLNRAITNLGFNVVMVHETLGYNQYRVKWPDDILSMQFARRAGYQYIDQRHHAEMAALNETIDTFVVGSDQLWNPLIGRVNDDLFLDFVGPDNRRIAYATSFGNRGTKKFKPDFIAKHRENLQKFSGISVREGYAVTTAREVFGVDAELVVDPVFLLPRTEYETLAQDTTLSLSGDYLAMFYLDPTPEKRDVAVAIADKLGLKRIVVIPNPDGGRTALPHIVNDERFEVLPEDSPENFLHAYSHASYVVTDSFHGTAFAVIFEKPFSTIYNTHRGADRFKNLMSSLGFGETRRVFEADTPGTLLDNPNVSRMIDFSAANSFIEAERKASLNWLKMTLSPQHAKTCLFTTLKETYQTLMPRTTRGNGNDAAHVDQPRFSANSEIWRITAEETATNLTVAAGGAVRGNVAWCELPFELEKGSAYRLTLNWAVHTSGRGINLHVRNHKTGAFKVIGTVAVNGKTAVLRSDSVEFIAPDDGFTQFMIGAVHFGGSKGGASVKRLTLEEIAAITAPQAPKPATAAKKPPSYAEQAMSMALSDNRRFVDSYTHNVKGKGLDRMRARIMFHAHAIEKGLSHANLRPGFGRIAVPGLAQEMASWLAGGNDPQDVIFQIGAATMKAYFQRHKEIGRDVTDFHALFTPIIHTYIEAADQTQGGVLAARADREPVAQTDRGRSFLDVVYGRRSVREFTSAPVLDQDIRHAVQIAMQAPSVCNRQSVRVHLFDDPVSIKAALDIQGGFGGYGMPPKLLLVTSELSAFLFAAERNQPYIDGGLFMMNLLLGLQQVGLGSCSLNTAMGPERDTKIRKILNISDTEVLIAFIAVGHYDPEIMIPRSRRIPVDTVLVSHSGR